MAPSKQDKMLEWGLYSRTRQHLKRLDEAKRIVERALPQASWLVSWSTGKDSTALAHLVRSMAPDTPIIAQFDDCDWPGKRDYAERVAAAQGWNYRNVEPGCSAWDYAREYQIGFAELCAQSHDMTRDTFLRPLAQTRADLGCDGVMMGLRCAESRARKLNLAKRGAIYRTRDGWRCCPLMNWAAEDVFAYLVAHGVEINPMYFWNRFMPPEEIRLCWALPTPAGRQHGDMEHMRYYWPEQFRLLRDEGGIY